MFQDRHAEPLEYRIVGADGNVLDTVLAQEPYGSRHYRLAIDFCQLPRGLPFLICTATHYDVTHSWLLSF